MTLISFYHECVHRDITCSDPSIACSGLRDSRVCDIEKARNGCETGERFPATAPFRQIARSYFRAPFTYASSLLFESLEQANPSTIVISK